MPLGSNVSDNIKELYKDNKKSGKARGANGKPRSHRQIIAIAIHAAEESGAKVEKRNNPASHARTSPRSIIHRQR